MGKAVGVHGPEFLCVLKIFEVLESAATDSVNILGRE